MNETTLHSNLSINFDQINSRKPVPKVKTAPRPRPTPTPKPTSEKTMPEGAAPTSVSHSAVKLGFMGGLEQVGENMMYIEYKNEIIVLDAGIVFPGGEMFGIDYIIPDVSYLKSKKANIKAVLITHGHLDHIGALKHVLPDLGFPIVYSSILTINMIKKQLEEAKLLKDFKYKVIDPDIDILKLGSFTAEFFRVNHNIPESMGIALHTPHGLVVHTGDFKIDFSPAVDKVADLSKIARLGQEGVKVLMCESTNAQKPGRTPSEKGIGENLEAIIKDCKNRMIIATFASNIGRVIQIIQSAVKYNKTVYLAGRSMVNNVEIVKQLGYITVPHNMIKKLDREIDNVPDEKVVVLCTGSQGEDFSALSRISKGEHQFITLKPGDKVLTSSTPIPGNEKAVISMINDLIRHKVDVITNQDLDIHASGHGFQEDIKMMISLLKPEYFIPVHGELVMRYANKKLGLEVGIKEENIFLLDNGSIVDVHEHDVKVSDKMMKLDTVMIDGLGIGHLSGEYVMKARKIMAEDGIVSLIFKVDSKTKELVGNIQIESRGFVYSSEVKKMHTNIVDFVKKKYYDYLKKNKELKDIMKNIKEELGEHINKIVGRVPMIIPAFVYINKDPKNPNEDMPADEALVGLTLEEQGVE